MEVTPWSWSVTGVRVRRVNHVNSQSSIDIHNSLLRGGINMLILDEQQRLHWVLLTTSLITTSNNNYRPQRSCGQGNVFTGVYHSFCSQGGGFSGEPPRQGEPPPGRENPPFPRQGEPPPGSRLQHTVYERPVRILLECILVGTCFNEQFLYIKLFVISKTSIVRPPIVQRIWP